MTTRYSSFEGFPPISAVSHEKPSSPGQAATSPGRLFLHPPGVANTREFLSKIGGKRTRWPLLIVASALTVCFAGFSTSRVLFEDVRPAPANFEEQSGLGLNPSDSPAAGISPEKAVQSDESRVQDQASGKSKKPMKGFSFFFQPEAEAALERDPGSVSVRAVAVGENSIGSRDYKSVIAPHENVFSPDTASPGYSQKSERVEKLPLDEQVRDLLRSVSSAVKSEDIESFLELLDDSEPAFVRLQKLKAELVFRRFDEIDGTYSDVKISVLNDNELAIKLHCKVKAAFARSGRSIVLFDGHQDLTLRSPTQR